MKKLLLNLRAMLLLALSVYLVLAPGTVSAEIAKVVHYQGVKTNTPLSMTLYGWLTINGKPAPAGTEIAVYDQNGILCGASGVEAGQKSAYLLQIYGDDSTSPGVDEGFLTGEALRFEVAVPKAGKKGGPVSWTVIAHKSFKFSSAGLPRSPSTYPPIFADKADYGMNISSGK